ASDAGDAVIEVLHVVEIVDENHVAGALPSEVPSQRGPLPEYLVVAGVLRIERALAIGEAADQGAGALLSQHITVGEAVSGEYVLDHRRQPSRCGAEKAMAGLDDLG